MKSRRWVGEKIIHADFTQIMKLLIICFLTALLLFTCGVQLIQLLVQPLDLHVFLNTFGGLLRSCLLKQTCILSVWLPYVDHFGKLEMELVLNTSSYPLQLS